MSSETAFENYVLGILLWCFFQTAVKIPYNLSIYVLFVKQDVMITEQFFIVVFCIYVLRVYDLKIYIMYN